MSRIAKLSPELVAAIAAGQVIERPSSVVKELLENSLDAGATSIVIKLVDGGRQEITVIDDGQGMSKEDVLASVQPHSTSKINALKDLHNILTFGFRGEALASIALVSNITVQSKEAASSLGHLVHVKHGKQMDDHSVGMASGTIIRVTELFKFLPARKKFLKSASIEVQQIFKVVLPILLVHLSVKFRIEHNNTVLVDCAAGQTFLERVMIVLNQEYHSKLLPVQFSQAGYSISGFIGAPQIASNANAKQLLWVNNRSVHHTIISKTVKSLYGTLLEPRALPVFFLQLDVDPQTIDVNTHPQKTTVAFAEEEIVINVVMGAIRQTLDRSGLTYSLADSMGANARVQDNIMDEIVADALKKTTEPWNVRNIELSSTTKYFQLHKLYIFVEVEDGMVVIDQHAAHERILYEQFLHAYYDHTQLHQVSLSSPQKLQIANYQSLSDHSLGLLKGIGISLEEHSDGYFITKIPVILQHRNYQEYVREVIEQSEELLPYELDAATHKTLSFLACRSAIKAGEPLSAEEQKNLVEKLLITTTNYTCPHGRPVLLHMTMDELAHHFKRTGF
jgi:DNA mismatch repair protein MutL